MAAAGGERGKDSAGQETASRVSCSCSLAGTRYCQTCEFNPDKRAVRITSARSSEFTADIVVEGVRFHVQTEKFGPRKPIIITTVLKDGAVISSKKTDYSDLLSDAGMNAKLMDLMRRQHLDVIKALKEEKPSAGRIPAAYLDDVKRLLQEGNQKAALKTLRDALTEHPFNPFLLSYYGCLEAIVDKNHEHGMEICRDAINILNQDIPFGQEAFYPVFYLNFGRACLAGGDKKEAATAFKKGLEADPQDPDLLWEVKRLGSRRKPAIPFLKRSNPLNKYVGILLHKLHPG
jgi:tetratricopeptide (TPR) repeat protein